MLDPQDLHQEVGRDPTNAQPGRDPLRQNGLAGPGCAAYQVDHANLSSVWLTAWFIRTTVRALHECNIGYEVQRDLRLYSCRFVLECIATTGEFRPSLLGGEQLPHLLEFAQVDPCTHQDIVRAVCKHKVRFRHDAALDLDRLHGAAGMLDKQLVHRSLEHTALHGKEPHLGRPDSHIENALVVAGERRRLEISARQDLHARDVVARVAVSIRARLEDLTTQSVVEL